MQIQCVFFQLFVPILLTVSVFNSEASLRCYDIFSSQNSVISPEDAFETIGELEAQINELILQSRASEYEIVSSIKEQIDDLILRIGVTDVLLSDIENIKKQIADFLSQRNTSNSTPSENVATLKIIKSDTLIDFVMMDSKHAYLFEIHSSNGKTDIMPVYFSDRVIEDFFRLAAVQNSTESLAASKLLKAIHHGFVGSSGSNGIKKLIADKTVLEIGFVGSLGAWRLGAYQHLNALYITHAVSSGNHGSQGYEQTFIRSVNRVRHQNGHD